MPIDTDDLSDKTYRAVMVEAEKFDHNLTLQFGLLSYQCKDETDFIRKSKFLIKRMLKFNRADMEDMFFGEPPAKKAFHDALWKILGNLNGKT